MIILPSKSLMKKCVVPKLTETGNCIGPDCMAWKYWVPPVGCDLKMSERRHGMKDYEKLGYCGLTGNY